MTEVTVCADSRYNLDKYLLTHHTNLALNGLISIGV